MIFNEFVEANLRIWNTYFKYLSQKQKEGRLNSNGDLILYPNILLATNCADFYVIELIGATKEFSELIFKTHKERSIYRYLNQFDDSEPIPLFHLNNSNGIFSNLCLSHAADFELVRKRFPSVEQYDSVVDRVNGKGSVFSFGENFESVAIENCILVNQKENVYRCKSILFACVFNAKVTSLTFDKFYLYILGNKTAKAVHTVSGKSNEKIVVAGQLQSMYLFPGMHETTIGAFLKLHPDIIKNAFKTSHFEYEPYLEWKEHDGTCNDTAINPDLLIKRPDGYYDIYDLKTALLSKKKLTKDTRSRRRFIDVVAEGFAQLVNYQEYFRYPLNAEYAKQQYGLEVKDPKLVLVVGNWENSCPEEIKQACRINPRIEVIDYDTFCHLFIGTKACKNN